MSSQSALVRHTRHEPVFVVGNPRSGTSLTVQLLRDHLGVNFGTESQFFIRYHRRLASYGDLRDDARMRMLFDDLSRERFFVRTRRSFGFVLDVDAARRSLRGRTYPDALRAIFEQFTAQQGFTRWGDKTPEYSGHLPTILEMFPEAQFVHVLRDGRDVAMSSFKTAFGPKSAHEAAIAWRRSVSAVWQFGETLPPNRFHEIRYDDLVDDPVAVLTGVARFLGIDEPTAVVQRAASALRAQVRTPQNQSWRVALSRHEIAAFESIAGAELRRAGFPLAFGGAPQPVTSLRVGYWWVQGMSRRLRMRKYWADNWYKLGLRARAATLPLRRLARRDSRRPAGRVLAS